jgi:hypothetical protein
MKIEIKIESIQANLIDVSEIIETESIISNWEIYYTIDVPFGSLDGKLLMTTIPTNYAEIIKAIKFQINSAII